MDVNGCEWMLMDVTACTLKKLRARFAETKMLVLLNQCFFRCLTHPMNNKFMKGRSLGQNLFPPRIFGHGMAPGFDLSLNQTH